MQERVETLTKKLIERLRPFVEAKKPGEKDDAETLAFEAKMRREVEDLKLESFGIEVSTIFVPCLHIPVHSGKIEPNCPARVASNRYVASFPV